ncbi:probable E3 ubiquitin-protein ligase TRIML2 [Saccopteryx leptura]|uniref:probable E3 ubiquitin-protein ligase TRIML2 n=1 Tax=Saccopteryx leptura TaxID=249018 RepID=UPI00339C94B9
MSQSLSPALQQNVPEDACGEKHLQPARLFCEDDQATLCDKCFLAQEHQNHVVCGVQEVAEHYRKLFQELLTTLKAKLEAANSLLAEEQERMAMVQEEEQNFKDVIESEYEMMFRLMTEEKGTRFQNLQGCVFSPNLREASLSQLMEFATELEEKLQETLQQAVKRVSKKMVELTNKRNHWLLNKKKKMLLQGLDSLGRENMRKLQASEGRLSEQICSLQKTTAELEKKCGEAASVLLKDARDCLERIGGPLLLQCLEPAQITDPSLCQIPGMSKMLEAFQRPITLDRQTAHPYLVLSEDLRSVRLRNVQLERPGNPGRFDFRASVLGVESFTSGRHYWEVDVENATKWQLGVYGDFVSRKGIVPKASGDKVLLMGSMMGTDYTFWVFPSLKRVSLGQQMHKLGVFLDYKYGQISFYDVSKRLLIYNFSRLVFQGALRPIFSLCFPNGDTNSDTLSICLPNISRNVTVSSQSS